MAMTDYFYECNKLESKTVSDGLGGFETVEYVGIAFMGLAVRKNSTEQLVGALRGNEQTIYNFHCESKIPLEKDNKIVYTENGEKKYIRLTSNAIINAEQSAQTDWKTYEAEKYTPTTIITG